MTRFLSVTEAKYNVVCQMIANKTAYLERHCSQTPPQQRKHEDIRCVHARFELKRLKRLSDKLEKQMKSK